MSVDPSLARSREPFDGGRVYRGAEGLKALSVSCVMHSAHPEQFRARVAATLFGDVPVTRIRARSLRARRTTTSLGDAYGGLVQIGFVLSGATVISQGDRRMPAGPGEVVSLFNGKTFESHMEPTTEVVQFYLPVKDLRARGIPETCWAGRVWPLMSVGRIVMQMLTSITAAPDAVPEGTRPQIGRALTELGFAMFAEVLENTPSLPAHREALRIRVLAQIGENFADPALDAGQVASRLGLSRRYLYSLFEGQGPGVAELLRRTRLQHAASLLDDVRSRQVSIASVAAASGFRGTDQFTRAFKRVHGLTPREFRRLGRDRQGGTVGAPGV